MNTATTQTEDTTMFTPISRDELAWAYPALIVDGQTRMVVKHPLGTTSFSWAEVELPPGALELPDGWYRCPGHLLANAVWRTRSRKAANAVLNKVVIVVEYGRVTVSRLERAEEGYAWNAPVNHEELAEQARALVPPDVRNGIFPCPDELAAQAVWPTRKLVNVSERYGDREEAGVRDILELASLMGARAPRLRKRLSEDAAGRDIRVYMDTTRGHEIVLSDIWVYTDEAGRETFLD